MTDRIIAVLKRAIYKMRFKGISLGLNSHIIGDCYLPANTIIGSNSFISNVNISVPCKIDDNCTISNLQIGAYSYIAKGCKIKNVSIGKFCSIGPEVYTGFGLHPTNLLSTSPVFYSNQKQCGMCLTENTLFEESPTTTIGNDVWIGARVIIKDGVKIGNGAIIGAGAVVVNDVEPYAIVGGVPAKIIRHRFNNSQIEKLEKIEWWNWEINRLKSNQAFFVNSTQAFFDSIK